MTRHWSGKRHQVMQGINLISLVWSDGDAALPCDYRLYNKDQDGLSKNYHLRQFLETAHERGFWLGLVAFDSWYIEEELGITPGLLNKWKVRYRLHPSIGEVAPSEQRDLEAENRRLRRELELVKAERELLKKVVRLFSADGS